MLLLAVARVRALQGAARLRAPLRALATTGGAEAGKVPVTLLSGFLGTGKTTLLRNLLEEASEDKDKKIGVVVNDMASVNIDAKITARRLEFDESEPTMQGAAEFVEIGDGCVCCSMADELFTTLAELSAVSSMKGYRYNHIVIEATGIAEPRSIRDQFQDAEASGMPLMDEVELHTLVTVVDSAAFLDAYAETASIAQRPDLAAPADDDDPSPFLMARFDHSLQRSVVDLLVEQVECADVLLLNKKDLVSQAQMDRLSAIMRALNPNAVVKQCEFGDASLSEVLGVAGEEGAARIGPVDEHKVAVAASKGAACIEPDCSDPSHLHAHDAHDHAEPEVCTDPTHDHSHKDAAAACADPVCTDPTHDHGHKAHDHAAEADCADPVCTDPTHDHSHKDAAEDCAEPGCTDPTHDHSHKGATHAALGIDSFVYAARRPFAPARLQELLRALPADVTAAFADGNAVTSALDPTARALATIVRSKGFLWLATSHDAAYYWSHAGNHFAAELQGRWWATLPEDRFHAAPTSMQRDSATASARRHGGRDDSPIDLHTGTRRT
jgi:G3E family GTPase